MPGRQGCLSEAPPGVKYPGGVLVALGLVDPLGQKYPAVQGPSGAVSSFLEQ